MQNSHGQWAASTKAASRGSVEGEMKHKATASNGAFLSVERKFLCVAAMILLGTASLKVIGVLVHNELLPRHDPVFIFLTNKQVMILAATIELATCASFLRSDSIERLVPLACLSSVFLIYKLGFGWLKVPLRGCPCMGFVEEWLPLGKMATSLAANIMLIFLLLGSFGLLSWAIIRGHARSP
jgi:hypothetical protein